MKKQLLTLALSALSFSSFAKIMIVDNNGNNPQNYTSLQKAIDDSGEGDTLYVKASTKGYGDVELKKAVILLGDGYNSSLASNSMIGTITYTKDIVESSKIAGFYIGYIIYATHMIQNLEISNNHISFIDLNQLNIDLKNLGVKVVLYNCKIYNNYIGNLTEGYLPNTLISNNLISLINYINQYPSDVVTLGSTIISNNIISNDSPTFNTPFTTYQNNYFNSLSYNEGKQWSLFNNNLYNKLNDYGGYSNLPFGNDQSGIGIFENFDQRNFHLHPDAKGVKGGTDGTDIGIYGGMYPWKDYPGTTDAAKIMSPISMVKEIYMNATVPTNSIIKVDIKAKSVK